jgi:hypothetical protein
VPSLKHRTLQVRSALELLDTTIMCDEVVYEHFLKFWYDYRSLRLLGSDTAFRYFSKQLVYRAGHARVRADVIGIMDGKITYVVECGKLNSVLVLQLSPYISIFHWPYNAEQLHKAGGCKQCIVPYTMPFVHLLNGSFSPSSSDIINVIPYNQRRFYDKPRLS